MSRPHVGLPKNSNSQTANSVKPVILMRFTDFPMLGLNQAFFYAYAYPLNLT